MTHSIGRAGVGFLLGVAISVLSSISLWAATITVTTKADVIGPDGLCSLREAIISANNNPGGLHFPGECAFGEPLPVVDTIVFADLPSPDIYKLTKVGANENFAITGDLDILESVNIIGNGSLLTIIDGNESDRVFHIIRGPLDALMVTIEQVTIRNGRATHGAGIKNFLGELTIKDSLVTSNEAECSALECAGVAGTGGGIFNDGGMLDLLNTEVSFNSAKCFHDGCGAVGGGIYSNQGRVALSDSKVSSNLVRCTFPSCSAGAGGIYFDGFVATPLAITQSSEISFNDAECLGNVCDSFGGGIFVADGEVTIDRSGVNGNSARCQGGTGPDDLTCFASGGGIFNNLNGFLHLFEATIHGNAADCMFPSCGFTILGARGGGIANHGGTLLIRRSTLSGNLARGNDEALGGGVASRSVGLLEAPVIITNSTFSGNVAECVGLCQDVRGGGLFNDVFESVVSISFSTFSDNSAGQFGSGGGIASVSNFNPVTIKNSIVAKNSPEDCVGPFMSPGDNLDSDGSCPGFATADPHLLPLANYGGPTKTHALSFSSQAVDAAADCTDIHGNPVTTDQRGTARPQGPACDLGAYEVDVGKFASAQALLEALKHAPHIKFQVQSQLMGPLHEILDLLTDDRFRNDRAVCGKVTAFLRQVDSVERRGELGRADAALLRGLAGEVQEQTGCASPAR